MAKKKTPNNAPDPKPVSKKKTVVKQEIPVIAPNIDTSNKETANNINAMLELLQKSLPVIGMINKNSIITSQRLSSIESALLTANTQRQSAANIAEEVSAEVDAEASLKQEINAETTKDQNAEIITKLSTLDSSINDIDIGGAGGGGGGLMDMLGSLLKMGLQPLITAIMPILASAVSLMLPLLAAIITVGAAYGLGTLLYKYWIEPSMDASTKNMEDNVLKTSKGIESTQVTNDKGEKVFAMTTNDGTETMMSESQAIKSIEKSRMSPTDKLSKINQLKVGGESVSTDDASFAPVSNSKDQAGMAIGVQYRSGSSLENLQAQKDSYYQEIKDNPVKAFEKQIVEFDVKFRKTLMSLSRHITNRDLDDPSWLFSPEGEFTNTLNSLFNEHLSIIKRIRSAGLPESDLKYLDEGISPIFNTAFIGKNDPDIDLAGFGAGYDLPSGASIGLTSIIAGKIDREIGELTEKGNEIRSAGLGGITPEATTPTAMRDGGFVKESPSSQGRTINVAEAGTGGEFVVPYEKMGILLSDAQSMAEGTEVGERITGVMRDSYLDERDASSEPSSVVVNNINQGSRSGGGGEAANFQFQTDLSRTFDNIFDMILEKNMRTGVL
jgi:hypothetical protein